MTKQQRAFVTGFLKAANGAQIPSTGAPNMPQPTQIGGQPGQPQPGQPQAGQQQIPQIGGGQQGQPQGSSPLFYQLLQQLKQQHPMPQVPPPVTNMHNHPMGA